MNETKGKQDLESELEKSAVALRTLRDQIRVQIHLGRLDAKDEWERLAPKLEETLERAKSDLSEATRKALDDVTQAAKRFSRRLL